MDVPIQIIESSSSKNTSQQVLQKAAQQSQRVNREQLRQELMAMHFEQELISRALLKAKDLESAIELIIFFLEEQDASSFKAEDTVQMVLLVRMDLKMGMGKIAAQCAHGILKSYKMVKQAVSCELQSSNNLIRWMTSGQQKKVYQVDSEEQLFICLQQLEALGIRSCHIRDAGRTQIAAGSVTVGVTFPCLKGVAEKVTRCLRLL